MKDEWIVESTPLVPDWFYRQYLGQVSPCTTCGGKLAHESGCVQDPLRFKSSEEEAALNAALLR